LLIFFRFGIPRKLSSDNGTEFVNKEKKDRLNESIIEERTKKKKTEKEAEKPVNNVLEIKIPDFEMEKRRRKEENRKIKGKKKQDEMQKKK
jgi:hypothetical protein